MMRPFCATAALAVVLSAHASDAPFDFSDAAKEAQYRRLVTELRCLVCQNQNLEDSHATLARDLKEQVYEQVNRGASDEQIVAYMVERYGDFVRYRPPFKASTALLWMGPLLMIVGGGIAVFRTITRYRRALPREESDAVHGPEQKS